MVSSSPVLRAQEESSSSQNQQQGGEPDLLWLVNLTGAHIGLAPIPQDPEDRCSIWENLVSLVDFQCPGFPLTSEELCDYIDIPHSPVSSGTSAVTATLPLPPPLQGDIDYKNNPRLKPPYSYATLICMAMEASKEPKLTLAAICKWISDNFCYFRRAHPTWQSSIRHNLCINKRFIKVPREKGEPGRGAFWKLHPQYAEWLKSSSQGHKTPPEHIPAASGRRAQPAARRGPRPAPPSSPQSCLEVGAELQQLLQEFEEFESCHSWNPSPPAEASWLPSAASGNQEEPGELMELKGGDDWEALLNPPPELGDFSTLEPLQLSPPSQPETLPLQPPRAQEQHLDWPQGQNLDQPQGQNLDWPQGQNLDQPQGQNLDWPQGQNLDWPQGQNLDWPHEQHLDQPQGQNLDQPQGQNLDWPQGQNLDWPQGQHLDQPQGQNLDWPHEQHLDQPQGQNLDWPQEQNLDWPQGQNLDWPQGQNLDQPQGQDLDWPQGLNLDWPQGQNLDWPQGQDLDWPQGLNLDWPQGQNLDWPQEQHLDWPQEQQQVLAKPSPTKPGLDETLMATAFLEAAWHEEGRENLPSSIPEGQGAVSSQASLPSEDVIDWDSMVPFNSLLEIGDEIRSD